MRIAISTCLPSRRKKRTTMPMKAITMSITTTGKRGYWGMEVAVFDSPSHERVGGCKVINIYGSARSSVGKGEGSYIIQQSIALG